MHSLFWLYLRINAADFQLILLDQLNWVFTLTMFVWVHAKDVDAEDADQTKVLVK